MRLAVAAVVGATSLFFTVAAASRVRVRVPAFSLVSNLAYLPAALLAAVHWNENPTNAFLALALVQLCVASSHWHAKIDEWERSVHEADLLAMVSVGFASVAVAAGGVCGTGESSDDCSTIIMVVSLLVLAALAAWKEVSLALESELFKRASTGLLLLFALLALSLALLAEALRAEDTNDHDTLTAGLLLSVPTLWVSAVHAMWGTQVARETFSGGLTGAKQSLGVLRRYDAVCGSFHALTALSTCVLVGISGRGARPAPDPGALAIGIAGASSSLPLLLILSVPSSSAWESDLVVTAFGACACIFAATTAAVALATI